MDPLTLINSDCLAALKTLPDESVQCCVTSPPYYALRDYGHAGQIGLEETPQLFVAKMVEVFEEVRRVLRTDGTLWLNLGDSYAGSRAGAGDKCTTNLANIASRGSNRTRLANGRGDQPAIQRQKDHTLLVAPRAHEGMKPKDLMGIPWRVALALQDAGWWLRSDIIWHKPNPMPESVTDRPTKAHEYIFLLTKSDRYYYDAEAILEQCSDNTHARVSQNVAAQIGSERANGGQKTNGNMKACVRGGVNPKAAMNAAGNKQNESFSAAVCLPVLRRNKRTVWTVPAGGTSEAHFATFPPDLIKPCIMAGSKPGDVVMDPFGGSGTTGMVALELARRGLLIELNPEYCDIIRRRCAITPGLALSA
jgi:DNA modification methylase